MRRIATDVARSVVCVRVCVSVCLCACWAQTVEPIEIPFGCLDPNNHVLDESPVYPREGLLRGTNVPPARGYSTAMRPLAKSFWTLVIITNYNNNNNHHHHHHHLLLRLFD